MPESSSHPVSDVFELHKGFLGTNHTLGRWSSAQEDFEMSAQCMGQDVYFCTLCIEGKLKDSFYRYLALIFHVHYSTKLMSGLCQWQDMHYTGKKRSLFTFGNGGGGNFVFSYFPFFLLQIQSH